MTRLIPAPPDPSPAWAFFLDFDGTLVSIAEIPEAVVVPGSLLVLLRRLSEATGNSVAIVTGRSLTSLDRLLYPVVVQAAGQHGLEWRDEGGPSPNKPAARDALSRVRKALAELAAQDARLLLEDKGLSVALHYRQAPDRAAAIGAAAERLLSAAGSEVDLIAGKCVVEFRGSGAGKGKAIRHLQSLENFGGRRPVMIGDDVTDEDGFDAVNEQDGISILVGDRAETRARFALPSVGAVHEWLGRAC